MSRDRRDSSPGAADAPEPGAPPADELLTAYLDAVDELPVDERRAIEARLTNDPAARADADAVAAMLGRLRALPPEGAEGADEPDWQAMERSIRQAVAELPMRPWWRSWRWLAPALTCATAAVVMLALWPRSSSVTAVAIAVPAPGGSAAQAGPAAAAGREPPAGEAAVGMLALWLDGGELDVDLSRAETGGALGQLLGADAGESPEVSEAPDGARDDLGLWPATGMAWVDTLDDAALDRVEHLLESPGSPERKKG